MKSLFSPNFKSNLEKLKKEDLILLFFSKKQLYFQGILALVFIAFLAMHFSEKYSELQMASSLIEKLQFKAKKDEQLKQKEIDYFQMIEKNKPLDLALNNPWDHLETLNVKIPEKFKGTRFKPTLVPISEYVGKKLVETNYHLESSLYLDEKGVEKLVNEIDSSDNAYNLIKFSLVKEKIGKGFSLYKVDFDLVGRKKS